MFVYLTEPLRKLNYHAGILVFGNQSGFLNNFYGRLSLYKSRKLNTKLLTKQRQALKEFKKKGIYKVPILIDKELLLQVKDSYTKALSDPARSVPVISKLALEDGIEPYCISTSSEHVPELKLLITDQLKEYIGALLGEQYQLNYIVARRTKHVPADVEVKYDVYSNSWHFDNEPCNRIKLFIALSDIDDKCGPLHIFDRISSRNILRMGFKNRDDYGIDPKLLMNSKSLTKMTGSAGTCFFANVTQCLHRAGIPWEGNFRDIVEIQFETKQPY